MLSQFHHGFTQLVERCTDAFHIADLLLDSEALFKQAFGFCVLSAPRGHVSQKVQRIGDARFVAKLSAECQALAV